VRFLLIAFLATLLVSCKTSDERAAHYKVRWEMFFDAVLAAFDAGEAFDNKPLDQAIWDFECRWAHI
jgi:hypothetical protein